LEKFGRMLAVVLFKSFNKMSANNLLTIYKKGNKFVIGHSDLDCGWIEKEMIITDTLEEAIKKANKYQEENMVEYGLKINID